MTAYRMSQKSRNPRIAATIWMTRKSCTFSMRTDYREDTP